MSGALAGPVLVAGALLPVSGVAKLRRPQAAADALAALGVRCPPAAVRLASLAELALGLWALLGPGRLNVALLSAAYAGFALLTVALARRRAACGCFGTDATAASPLQAILSAALATGCGLAVLWPPPRLGWIVSRPGLAAAVLLVSLGGATYAAVTAYTQLPQAWSAWSGR